MQTNKPTVYILVGVPGSGKSTWIRNQQWVKDIVMVSTDDYIEMIATKQGKTYSEVFDDNIKAATQYMLQVVETAKDCGQSIVWDQTNVSIKSRRQKLKMLPNYHKVAVFFQTPEQTELSTRLANRIGKNIPNHVIKSMIENLEIPSTDEGFDEIWMAA